MTPIQQLFLGTGSAVATKTYIDDIFSTYVYTGNGSARSINNGIDLSGEGGLLWVKNRDATESHGLFDSVRGATKRLVSNSSTSESTDANRCSAFNNNGFSLGTDGMVNASNNDYASWTFRKSPAFTICSWTGDGASAKTISHQLGSIPGLIIIKCTSHGGPDWVVWHRDFGATDFLKLNETSAKATDNEKFGGSSSVLPTSTTFTIGDSNDVNGSSRSYISYVFAGGESITDKAVDFDGNDSLQIASSADLCPGTSDFTWEAWLYPDSWGNSFDSVYFNQQNTGGFWLGTYQGNWVVRTGGTANHLSITAPSTGQWTHVAVTRKGSTLKVFYNGEEKSSISNSTDWPTATTYIGNDQGGSTYDGRISNLRFVKGQSLYTTDFNVLHDPLTTTSQGAYSSNVKLICCNGSTATSSTVTPSTITANGDPTVTTNNSIFDDSAANVFGESGSESVIKCGSFRGNGSATGPEINLGFEPQWVLTKNADISDEWYIFDNMRGIVSDGYDPRLRPNSSGAEASGDDRIDVTPTGFKIKNDNGDMNGDGNKIIYMCIRRPDGYVGKPVELGTGVFSIVYGTNSTNPSFVTNFPVDFAFTRRPTASESWYTAARLIQKEYLLLNTTDAEVGNSNQTFWYPNGWHGQSSDLQSYLSWSWKRHAGFDVLTYEGNGSSPRQLVHSMNNTVEMIWTKNRDSTSGWRIWHKDLNGGGSNAAKYYLDFETNNPTANGDIYGGQDGLLPTSTNYTIGGNAGINQNGSNHLALLFSSVSGISKVGSYTGNGSASGQTITLGFQPRFLILKAYNNYFWVLDTTRGWGSGNDKYLYLDGAGAEGTLDFGAPTSTGFTVPDNNGIWNANGDTYLYYAHA